MCNELGFMLVKLAANISSEAFGVAGSSPVHPPSGEVAQLVEHEKGSC